MLNPGLNINKVCREQVESNLILTFISKTMTPSPLRPPNKPTQKDGIFAALRRAVPKPHARERHKNEWILEETWRLVDERVSTRRGTGMHARIRRLGRTIRASLKRDRKRRVEIAGEEV